MYIVKQLITMNIEKYENLKKEGRNTESILRFYIAHHTSLLANQYPKFKINYISGLRNALIKRYLENPTKRNLTILNNQMFDDLQEINKALELMKASRPEVFYDESVEFVDRRGWFGVLVG